jgi:hypothetical protein
MKPENTKPLGRTGTLERKMSSPHEKQWNVGSRSADYARFRKLDPGWLANLGRGKGRWARPFWRAMGCGRLPRRRIARIR